MSTPKLKTPTSLSRSRFFPLSPAQRVRRPDLEAKVRVVVRIRPFLAHETEVAKGRPKSCLSITKANGAVEKEDTLHIHDLKTSRNESYKLDFCYGQEDEVGQVFSREVEPILPGLFRGSNATVFAYGATGSGKTYTMQGTEERPGLMPLAMRSILSMAENTESVVAISYYEVYMDRCYDLLEPKTKEVPVLEDSEGRIQLRGLAQMTVNSIEEFQEVFMYGCMRRKVGHTGLNDVSSRSHGVLMISVSSDDGNSNMPLVGKLNLIDLAGNEDNRRSGNDGIRLTESVKINQSLFALSNVIHALNANESRVPYRDSKLTRILQDSLGGMSRALMIACLNPSSYQEALHTVTLAARSRQIVNHVALDEKQDTPRSRVDMNAKLNAWLEAKGKINGRPVTPGSSSSSMGKLLSPLPSSQTSNQLPSVSKAPNVSLTTPKGRRLLGPPRRVKIASIEESPNPNSFKHGEQADVQSTSPQKGNTSLSTGTEDINQADSQASTFSEFKNNNLADEASFDKENRVVEEFSFNDKSPPLSTRLKQLQNALEELLTPHASNADKNLPLTVTPCKSLNFDKNRLLTVTPCKSSNVNEIFPSDVTPCKSFDAPLSKVEEPLSSNVASALPASEEQPIPINVVRAPPSDVEHSILMNVTNVPPNVEQTLPMNLVPCDKSCSILSSDQDHILPMNVTPCAKSFRIPSGSATPRTPVVEHKELIEEDSLTGTPLEKFSARSSGLKKTLAQNYLNFLNTASRDELLALKGIGEKRANYILELRETEPLNELDDLEKIGLTSKQIQNIVKYTARQIFG